MWERRVGRQNPLDAWYLRCGGGAKSNSIRYLLSEGKWYLNVTGEQVGFMVLNQLEIYSFNQVMVFVSFFTHMNNVMLSANWSKEGGRP